MLDLKLNLIDKKYLQKIIFDFEDFCKRLEKQGYRVNKRKSGIWEVFDVTDKTGSVIYSNYIPETKAKTLSQIKYVIARIVKRKTIIDKISTNELKEFCELYENWDLFKLICDYLIHEVGSSVYGYITNEEFHSDHIVTTFVKETK